jgi:hypothetical protein
MVADDGASISDLIDFPIENALATVAIATEEFIWKHNV